MDILKQEYLLKSETILNRYTTCFLSTSVLFYSYFMSYVCQNTRSLWASRYCISVVLTCFHQLKPQPSSNIHLDKTLPPLFSSLPYFSLSFLFFPPTGQLYRGSEVKWDNERLSQAKVERESKNSAITVLQGLEQLRKYKVQAGSGSQRHTESLIKPWVIFSCSRLFAHTQTYTAIVNPSCHPEEVSSIS